MQNCEFSVFTMSRCKAMNQNKNIQCWVPFIGFLCPLPSTAVHVIAKGGRHTNGKGVLVEHNHNG